MITTLSNEKFKLFKSLHLKKYRIKHQKFIAEGIKLTNEAIKSGSISCILVSEDFDIKKITNLNKNLQIYKTSNKNFLKLSDLKTPEGVITICNIPFLDQATDSKRVVALDSISDPGNLGTIIRTLDWFGVNDLVLSGNCVDPYNSKVVRATMGSIFRVKIIYDELSKLIPKLEESGYKSMGLSLNGKTDIELSKISNENLLLVFGSESHGISKETEDSLNFLYKIPKKGDSESLNLSIAVGIIISQL